MTRAMKKEIGTGRREARSIQRAVKGVDQNGRGRSNEAVESDRAGKSPGRDGELARFRLLNTLRAGDPMIAIVRRVSERGWPKETRGQKSKIEGIGVEPSTGSRGRRRQKGRWPLDLVRECSGNGLLALRVWRDAGLERYGLSGGDMIFIGFDDPEDGGPALAAIDDKVVIGWYRRGRGGA